MADPWYLVDLYFGSDKGRTMVKHLIESYNVFISSNIFDIIDGFNTVEMNHTYLPEEGCFKYQVAIDIKNPVMSKPMICEKDGSTKVMTPLDARNRNFTYAAPLYVDVHVTTMMYNEETKTYVEDTKKIVNVCIGKIPIMVKSKFCVLNDMNYADTTGECKYDHGGYMIVNGNEKIIVSQNRVPENIPHMFPTNKATAYSHTIEIRSVQDNRFSVPKTTTLKLSSKPSQFGRYIRVNIHYVKQDMPVAILFRALGVETDMDIARHVFFDETDPLVNLLEGTLEEGNHVTSQRAAFDYLARHMNTGEYPKDGDSVASRTKKLDMVRNVLTNEFMPHVGPDFHKKALYLGYMINKLLRVSTGLLPFDDRDSYVNKRIDTPGILMANLMRQYYGRMIKEMKNMVMKEITNGAWKATNKFGNLLNKVNINKIIKSSIIEMGMKYGLATGNWGIKTNNTKAGVAQVANRLNPQATLSHLKRINTPVDKTVGKLVLPRKLHATQYGIICPAETPEGASVGLVKNMSMISGITTASDSTSVRDCLVDEGVIPYDGANLEIFKARATKVFVNGDIIGVHPHPEVFYARLKEFKRTGIFNVYIGISWKITLDEIKICTEGGRCVRPLVIVDQGNKPRYTEESRAVIEKEDLGWTECVIGSGRHGLLPLIEYLDVDENNMAMIAMQAADLTKGGKGFTYQPTYTHMELHASLMLGVLAGSIPFSDHNQAPRNCYQCLWLEEPVLMADGSWRPIKNVQVGDHVATFDPATNKLLTTTVVNQFVKATDKLMYQVTTTSGRTIRTTADHKFFTEQGEWIEAKDLIPFKTRVGIYTSSVKTHLLFAPIASIIRVPTTLIADITVAYHGHCFIGGQGFAVHNSAMGKQAIGRYTSNFAKRYDTIGNVLDYAEKPIVQTRIGKLVNNDDLPSGMNISVAIMTWTGYNQEDSVMLNEAAVQRGMFTSTGYVTYKEQNNKNFSTGEEEMFCKPDPATCKQLKPFNYDKLGPDGFVPVNTYVESGDVIIGKVMPQKNGSFIVNKDTSVPMKNNQSGYIDKIYRDEDGNTPTNGDGFGFAKVCVRSPKVPTIGDKFCVLGDTEVFVLDEGWMPIKDVDMSHQVLQLDPATRKASFGQVIEKHKFAHDGELVTIKGDSVDLVTTLNHKHLVADLEGNLQLVLASDLVGLEAFYKGAHSIDRPYQMTVPYDWMEPEELAYMYGVFIACGVVDVRSKVVRINQDKEITSNNFYEFCRRVQNSPTLEPWILGYALEFIDGLLVNGPAVLKSFCDDMANDIQMVALTAGIVVDIEQEDNEAACRLIFRADAFVEHDTYRLGRQHFKGYVYCVEVPTHVFLTRRGGKCVWTGTSSRHGQKGTVGMMYKEHDMPWMMDGTVPDLIINPHAIPSRMTIAQLMECLMGKACCAIGTYGDATPFTELSVEDIAKELEAQGLERYGNEIMYNSRTGEQINTAIFCGPTYYQRLKHMVSDKCHCLTPGHEVLTHRGWKAIELVTGDDMVASLNPETDVMSYKHPIEVLRFPDFKGKVYSVKNSDLDFEVTLDHKLYVAQDVTQPEFELVPAKEVLGKTVAYKMTAKWTKEALDTAAVPILDINFDEPVPEWFWQLSAQQCRQFIDFVIDKVGNTIFGTFETHNSRVADDWQRLCLHAGWWATIQHKEDTDLWTIFVSKDNIVTNGDAHESICQYQGPVYCLTVPGGVFYVRRNGKAHWTGNSRAANGPVVLLTRQPAEGRARDGGLRVGEMEVECLLAHGVASFLKERFMECSDNYPINVCKRCGMMANVNAENGIYSCKPCNNTTHFVECRIPYSAKLLFQEIQTMSIGTRFIT